MSAGGRMSEDVKTKVFLIGGAPGAGKTTLGSALARTLGLTSLSVDDLVTAAIGITTPDSHPGLHALRKVPYLEYFTNSSLDQLKADATLRHRATWPMVERVIRKHSRGAGIVIDGWHLRPKWVADLGLDNVWSGWIVPTAEVLEAREKKNLDFFQASTDPEQMLQNFLGRSHWYNRLIFEQAAELQMDILHQPGDVSVDDLCDQVLNMSAARIG